MTHSQAYVVRKLLLDLGETWPVYATKEPGIPDGVITVYNTDGSNDGRSMVDGDVWGTDGIQIRVRSSAPDAAYDKASEVRQKLIDVYDRTVTVDGETYVVHCFTRIGDVLDIGTALNDARSVCTVNADVRRR